MRAHLRTSYPDDRPTSRRAPAHAYPQSGPGTQKDRYARQVPRCQRSAAAATTINVSMSISLSSGRCLNVIRTACRISPPAHVSTARTPIALSKLPVDFHGELAKTLQKRLSTVTVAAAPFSMFASTWDWEAGADSSECELGSLVDWFHQSPASAPNRTVSSVASSRIDASAASGVRANSSASQPRVQIPRAIAAPTTRSQVRPDFADT